MPASFVFVGNTLAGAEIAKNLTNAGIPAAADIDSADVIITYCTSAQELENVYFDTGGVIARAAEGSYLIDLSPSSPAFAKELNAMASVSNLHAVEAPLVVVDMLAKHAYARKNVVVYVAGDQADIDAVEPFLNALAGTIHVCSSGGSAQLARCATTIIRAASMVSAAEASALLRKSETGPVQAVTQALQQTLSSEAAALLEAVVADRHEGTYTIDAINGELEAVMETADESGVVLPQVESCEYLFRMLSLIDGGQMAASAVGLLYLEEQEAAQHGLDWSRAEHMYAQMEDASEHHHHHDDDVDDFDPGFDDEFGMGFGYSPN